MLHILILAAGASSRMQGGDKLLEKVENQPLVTTMVQRALKTQLPVYVTLSGLDHPRAIALSGMSADLIEVTDAAMGMGHSICAGVAALPPNATGVMIVPADMPELTSCDLDTMIQAFDPDGPILRGASTQGKAGHPVIFPARFFGALRQLRGDTGARAIIQQNKTDLRMVTLPASHALTDLDTPEDWQAWRSSTT